MPIMAINPSTALNMNSIVTGTPVKVVFCKATKKDGRVNIAIKTSGIRINNPVNPLLLN